MFRVTMLLVIALFALLIKNQSITSFPFPTAQAVSLSTFSNTPSFETEGSPEGFVIHSPSNLWSSLFTFNEFSSEKEIDDDDLDHPFYTSAFFHSGLEFREVVLCNTTFQKSDRKTVPLFILYHSWKSFLS